MVFGLQKVMSKWWAGGVVGKVLEGGDISVGDSVSWCDEELDLWSGNEQNRLGDHHHVDTGVWE